MQKVPTEYDIDLEPLSVNRAWQGRRFKTKEYKNWTEQGLWVIKQVGKQEKPYNIEIDLYMAKLMDIDNPIKPLLDLLTKAGIIEDDRYINSLYITKIVSDKKKIVIRFV